MVTEDERRKTKDKRLIFLGSPGSGKGTQGARLAEKFGLDFIGMGDILREEIKRGSGLGKRVSKYVEEGVLVPDELILELIRGRVEHNSGFILDGFPRTLAQARELGKIVEIDKVIYLRCRAEVVVKRLSARRVCPGCARVYNLLTSPPREDELCDECGAPLEQREDDREDVIRERLRVYEEETSPLLKFYGAKLIEVDGDSRIEVVYSQVKEAILSDG